MEHAEMLPRDTAVQLIDADGSTVADETYAMPGTEMLLAAYRGLVDGRRINDQAGALVRQGRLAVYPSSHGQEACQIGAALAISTEDWLFPTYRDSVAVIARGVAPAEAMVLLKGDWHSGYDVRAHRVAPQATPLATQLLHAVGFAYAAKQRGEHTVVIALCGDGATSEGDFHEAMNFAAVFHVPVVFFVQNNEFAISVPLSRQTAAPSLAHKAIGYGMPGRRVDGNDVAAVLAVLGEAVDRARSGGGPTLVEAHTYRMQAHTNADDDTRYRERDEVRAWAARDPLTRLRTHLTGVGALTAELEAEYAAGAERIAAAMREALNADSDLDPEDLFRFVTETRSPQLEEQWQMLRGEIERTRTADAAPTAQATPIGGSR
ncbi:pyruvate dehydrogenase (acetyl-transferring) E1 component subunit alpha [Microbacterium sp. ANT_H45B]|uniref:pyruvate dehydrogenase (acetyl-transferring) E1 component subunit alpha n=1 Tax=unclassified Microbacterium TaxID=2609290 RepID=UPI0006FB0C58|nr:MULTISPECIES: pyruvate dehydrogenase (acetyl-transferring) E1 component subunit alpha [unclassified Microbacterium]KAA0959665.1 pyruvate dehydrogenase (acetyl-transferring) E1 component subunit alpha [Microbacterium sp. ANT_H45B]KQZ22936.1 pyruvate dehydrogenase (acetyl-transferring) E1 component subunit alpha [Microbacterium sp. Root553]